MLNFYNVFELFIQRYVSYRFFAIGLDRAWQIEFFKTNNHVFWQIAVIRVFPRFKCNLFYCSHCSVVQTPFGIEIFAFYCDFCSNAYWCVFNNVVCVKMSPCGLFFVSPTLIKFATMLATGFFSFDNFANIF